MKLWQGALIMLGSASVVVALGVFVISAVGDCRLVSATNREIYEFRDPRLDGARVVSKPRIKQEFVLVCGTDSPQGLRISTRIDGGAGP
jgi:hypothetical protein